MNESLSGHDRLLSALFGFAKDPLGHVLFAYPWGVEGTELANREGPNDFQRWVLGNVASGLLTPNEAIRLATASGHGVGKSALCAWLTIWAQDTMIDAKGVVTANTMPQLKTKTWVEVAKWHNLSLSRDLFKLTATKRYAVATDHQDTWRVDIIPWSEHNTVAFQGLHNLGKRIILLFDEASEIPEIIWQVSEGAMTDKDTEIIWGVFGNPTMASGRFRECFPGGRFAHRWKSLNVDARTVPHTNAAQHQQWIDDWGEDSDFVRVRVTGQFPRQDLESFISAELAREAAERNVVGYGSYVLGVDPARFGDDPAVIYIRKGLDGKSHPPVVFPQIDIPGLAAQVEVQYNRFRPDFIFVDSGGVGGGVVDILNRRRLPVIPVEFGGRSDYGGVEDDSGVTYANKRAEIWGGMRNWLKRGAIVDNIPSIATSLVDELSRPHYAMNAKDAVQLEAKQHMKSRGVKSPNVADALACTFAYPDHAFTVAELPGELRKYNEPTVYDDYNPLALGAN